MPALAVGLGAGPGEWLSRNECVPANEHEVEGAQVEYCTIEDVKFSYAGSNASARRTAA
jgi:hypothetical protein